jgi:hypothetical protein
MPLVLRSMGRCALSPGGVDVPAASAWPWPLPRRPTSLSPDRRLRGCLGSRPEQCTDCIVLASTGKEGLAAQWARRPTPRLLIPSPSQISRTTLPMRDLARAITEQAELAAKSFYRLVVVAGPPGSGKTRALKQLRTVKDWSLLNLNRDLSARLLDLTSKQRRLRTADIVVTPWMSATIAWLSCAWISPFSMFSASQPSQAHQSDGQNWPSLSICWGRYSPSSRSWRSIRLFPCSSDRARLRRKPLGWLPGSKQGFSSERPEPGTGRGEVVGHWAGAHPPHPSASPRAASRIGPGALLRRASLSRRCGRPVGVGFFAVLPMASPASSLSRSALRARDALVLEHLPLADAIASDMARRLFPLVEQEDLIQVAR